MAADALDEDHVQLVAQVRRLRGTGILHAEGGCVVEVPSDALRREVVVRNEVRHRDRLEVSAHFRHVTQRGAGCLRQPVRGVPDLRPGEGAFGLSSALLEAVHLGGDHHVPDPDVRLQRTGHAHEEQRLRPKPGDKLKCEGGSGHIARISRLDDSNPPRTAGNASDFDPCSGYMDEFLGVDEVRPHGGVLHGKGRKNHHGGLSLGHDFTVVPSAAPYTPVVTGPAATTEVEQEGFSLQPHALPSKPRKSTRRSEADAVPDIPRPLVAILTALPLEYEAVRTRLGELENHVHPQGTRAKVGRLAGTPWHVALVRIGEKSLNAAVLTERVVNWLQPEGVIFVGVAGSLKKDVRIGDVVVATKVVAYQGGKQAKDGFHIRPDAWHASHALEGAAFDALGTKAHFKPIAAGDVVLDDDASTLAEHIRHHYNDAVAIEMEANGISHAAELSRRVDALIIRGISDLANGLKSEADASGSQVRAAANAAEAALATVREMAPAPDSAALGPSRPTPPEAPAQYGGDHLDQRYGVYHGPVIGKVVNNNFQRPE